jgi:hypothetical protein
MEPRRKEAGPHPRAGPTTTHTANHDGKAILRLVTDETGDNAWRRFRDPRTRPMEERLARKCKHFRPIERHCVRCVNERRGWDQ